MVLSIVGDIDLLPTDAPDLFVARLVSRTTVNQYSC
mgnify:CR=1 FL=1